MLLSLVHQAQILFLVGSLILVLFLVVILIAATETRQEHPEHSDTLQGFVVALRDRSLLLFVLVNVVFTTYIALVSSTLPLYFTNVVSLGSEATPASGTLIGSIANLFTWWYIGLGAVLQVPLVQVLGSVPKVRVLGISMLLWGTGFILVWVSGTIASMQLVWAIASLAVLSVAATIYKPFAPAIVAELAPKSLRGAYLAISYQCWSIGYFVGPVLGGWAMDQSRAIARGSWLVAAIGAFFSLFILYFLGQSQSPNSVAAIEDPASVPQ
jgi:MFS family permease